MLLRGFLVEHGHDVVFAQYDSDIELAERDLLIFLETIVPKYVPLSKCAPLFFVNPEFLFERDFPLIKSSFGKVLCKTHEAHRICKEVFGEQAVYTGFLAEDKLREGFKKEARFLHIAGKSNMKNTQAVVDAWRWKYEGKSLDADLTVIADAEIDLGELPDRVTLLQNAQDDTVTTLQNTCMFHLQPSATEGFGHVLREALSVNALLITTGAPPMREITSALLLEPAGESKCRMATIYEVSPLQIHKAVPEVIDNLRDYKNGERRQEFLAGNKDFGKKFSAVLDKVAVKEEMAVPKVVTPTILPKREGKLTISFLGNFTSPESTENLVKWALERLGHSVIPLQENKVVREGLPVDVNGSDAFLWVRTPGWLQIPDYWMMDFIADQRAHGLPTISLHLDKFWQIPEREPQIGQHPFWKTEHVFTADGGFQKEFRERGVNHHWMKPAMSEVYLHPGIPRDEYLCDVGFVGAREYHAEYAFRPAMIDFLKKTYGSRFMHITNLRGHALNDFYASCKVLVADCIFAGTPNYWSDRAPETIGRGGFLLHPKVPGFDIPTALYKAQDLDSLKYNIDYFLEDEKARLGIARKATAHVAMFDTWTQRMSQILGTVGL